MGTSFSTTSVTNTGVAGWTPESALWQAFDRRKELTERIAPRKLEAFLQQPRDLTLRRAGGIPMAVSPLLRLSGIRTIAAAGEVRRSWPSPFALEVRHLRERPKRVVARQLVAAIEDFKRGPLSRIGRRRQRS